MRHETSLYATPTFPIILFTTGVSINPSLIMMSKKQLRFNIFSL